MNSPMVTVICLCYNQARFIQEAIESVLNQTYPSIQLIVVDDASSDQSQKVIRSLVSKHPAIEFISLPHNIGNCKAFNRGLLQARGEFILDFAADDILKPDRIAKQVDQFQKLGKEYGVLFTDATYIDESGGFLRNHYEYLTGKGLLKEVPQGDVFSAVMSRYFIASPTMMMRKSVFDKLGGYDEDLSYEDFDFWVRSSRICLYGFLNEKLTAIRKTKSSMSTGWYKIGDKQIHSTYLVCKKAVGLIRNEDEKRSLLTRLRYELRQCVFSHNKEEALLFLNLLQELNGVRMSDKLMWIILQSGVPVSWARNWYHKLRYS